MATRRPSVIERLEADIARMRDKGTPAHLRAIDEMTRMHEMVKPAYLRAIEEMNRAREMPRPAYLRAVEEITRVREMAKPAGLAALEEITRAREMAKPAYLRIHEEIARLYQMAKPAHLLAQEERVRLDRQIEPRDLSVYQQIAHMRDDLAAPLLAVQENLARMQRRLAESPLFQQQARNPSNLARAQDFAAMAAGDAILATLGALEGADESALESAVTKFGERVEDLITTASSGPQFADVYNLIDRIITILSFVITLMSFHSTMLSDKTLAEIKDKQGQLGTAYAALQQDVRESTKLSQQVLSSLGSLEAKLSSSCPPAVEIPKRTFYAVERHVHLRALPTTDAPIVSTLQKGWMVESLDERRGQRIKVRSYNPKTSEEQVGWVLKKYVRRLS